MKITELFDVCNSQSRFLVQQVFDRGYESDTNEGEIIDFSFIRFFFYKLNVHWPPEKRDNSYRWSFPILIFQKFLKIILNSFGCRF